MKEESLRIYGRKSARAEESSLIVSVRELSENSTKVVIGRAGSPNLIRELEVGDAAIYETPDYGVIEVRNMESNRSYVDLLLTQVSTRLGIAAGFIGQDESNRVFDESEVNKIRMNFEELKKATLNLNLSNEKIDLLHRKFDEMALSSQKYGRKDWVNLVSGITTGVILNATLDINTAKQLLTLMNSTFTWIFTDVLPVLFSVPQTSV
jgi:hypothetical protein